MSKTLGDAGGMKIRQILWDPQLSKSTCGGFSPNRLSRFFSTPSVEPAMMRAGDHATITLDSTETDRLTRSPGPSVPVPISRHVTRAAQAAETNPSPKCMETKKLRKIHPSNPRGGLANE
jgi:hypothetical protein